MAIVLALSIATRTFCLRDERLGFARSRWCNPSLAEFRGSYIAAVKHTDFRRQIGQEGEASKLWWVNTLFMCLGQPGELHDLSCKQYMPWKREYHECEFDSRVGGSAKMDLKGLGDVKVYTWDTKGHLYMLLLLLFLLTKPRLWHWS